MKFAPAVDGREHYISDWPTAADFRDTCRIMNAAAFPKEAGRLGRFVSGDRRTRTLDDLQLPFLTKFRVCHPRYKAARTTYTPRQSCPGGFPRTPSLGYDAASVKSEFKLSAVKFTRR